MQRLRTSVKELVLQPMPPAAQLREGWQDEIVLPAWSHPVLGRQTRAGYCQDVTRDPQDPPFQMSGRRQAGSWTGRAGKERSLGGESAALRPLPCRQDAIVR